MNAPDQPASETREGPVKSDLFVAPYHESAIRDQKSQPQAAAQNAICEYCHRPLEVCDEDMCKASVDGAAEKFIKKRTESASAPTQPKRCPKCNDAVISNRDGWHCISGLCDYSYSRPTLKEQLSAKTAEVETHQAQAKHLLGVIFSLQEQSRRLREELQNIANARPSTWDDPSQFLPWAQNRARHTLEKALSAPAPTPVGIGLPMLKNQREMTPEEHASLDEFTTEELEAGSPVREGDWVEKAAKRIAGDALAIGATLHEGTICEIIRRHLSESPSVAAGGWEEKFLSQESRYEHVWILRVEADERKGAMDAVWNCWQAWSEEHEPIGSSCPGHRLGYRMNCDVKKLKGESFPKEEEPREGRAG